ESLGTGKLISLEDVAVFAEITSRVIQLHELSAIVQVCHAPLREVKLESATWNWYDVACLKGIEEHTVDLVIVDGPAGDLGDLARYPALPVLQQWIRPGALILIDDADRPDEKQMVDRWQSEGLCNHRGTLEAEKGAILLEMR